MRTTGSRSAAGQYPWGRRCGPSATNAPEPENGPMSSPGGSGPARLGWPYTFKEQSWSDIADFERKIWGDHPEGRYLLDIIDSVLNSGVMDALAVTTSMHDLVVVGRPVPEPLMAVSYTHLRAHET